MMITEKDIEISVRPCPDSRRGLNWLAITEITLPSGNRRRMMSCKYAKSREDLELKSEFFLEEALKGFNLKELELMGLTDES